MKKYRLPAAVLLLVLTTLWVFRPTPDAQGPGFVDTTAKAEAPETAAQHPAAGARTWHAAPVVRRVPDPDRFPEVSPFQTVFPLEAFPEQTRAWVAAVEQGVPLRVDLGGEGALAWTFAPTPAAAEGFVVSTGTDSSKLPPLKTYRGRPLEAGAAGERDAFLSIVGGRAAMMIFRDEDILHVRQNADGAWEMEREVLEHGAWECRVVDGVSSIRGEAGLQAFAEESWDRISLTPDVAASDGRDPLSGELTLTDRRIPYGRQYAASLRSILGVMVWERVGANTENNIASRTATLLTLAASLNALYENQMGLNYLLQEVILLVDGSNWENDRQIYDSTQTGSSACLAPFLSWMQFHRPVATYRWTSASKIGRVSEANGWGYTNAAGTYYGGNTNNGTGFSLVGHEIGHNLGSQHTSGGLMNASSNTARDLFRMDSVYNSGETGAKMIWNYVAATTADGPRSYGTALLRNPTEIPFAVDDTAHTLAGQAVEIPVLANDLALVLGGVTNSSLTVLETGPVFPPQAGTASHSAGGVVFTPAANFSGVARFTYTLRGNVGNSGNGWLHKGDVAVVVEQPAADAPLLTAARGPAALHHHNERVILTWVPNGNRPKSWDIQRAVNGSAFEPLASVDGGDRHWIDLRIQGSASVRYRIRAADSGGGAGAWGYAATLPAAADPSAFWEDFSAGHPGAWEPWSNQPGSTAPDDSVSGRFLFGVQGGQAVLTATSPTESRLGLLVRPEVYHLAHTGALTLAADLELPSAGSRHHRVLAWLDEGGAVVWLGLERTRNNNDRRRIRLYAANSLADFFQQVGTYGSSTQIFENSQATETGYVNRHRATLTVSLQGVAMTAVPMERNSSQNASTLGLIPHGLSTFTGVGRFAVGGFSNPSENGPATFAFDNIAITSLPVPVRHLPALVDDVVETLPGEALSLAPFRNDLWIVENTAVDSVPAGWQVFTQVHATTIVSIHVPPGAAPGDYPVRVRARGNNYQASNDGLTAVSTVWVRVLDQASATHVQELVHYRGDPPLSFFPLANDWASGFPSLAQTDPRTFTHASAGLPGNSHRLLSASISSGGSLGSIALRTLPAVVNGSLVNRNSGEVVFTRAAVNEGTVTVTYTLEDSRGQTLSGTVLIRLLRTGAPRITAQPLGRHVTAGQAVNLSVTAAGSGLGYQWHRNGSPLSGATGASLSIPAAALSDAGSYHVVVTNSEGSLPSDTATVTVLPDAQGGPVISVIPPQTTPYETPLLNIPFTVSDPVVPDGQLELSAYASDGTLLPDAGIVLGGAGTNRTISLTPPPGLYGSTVVHLNVYNGAQRAESSFLFTVSAPPPPLITQQPQPQSAAQGGSAAFSVTASAVGTVRYQWFKDGAAIPGALDPTHSISPVAYVHSGVYQVRVSNDGGDTLSDPAVLTVEGAPFLLAQPQSQSVPAGAPVSLRVTVAGSLPMSYHWTGPQGPVSGINGPVLDIAAMGPSHAGTYSVTAVNSLGSVTSAAATLSILSPPPAPASLTATALAPDEISLAWNAVAGPVDGYVLEVAPASVGPWTLLAEQTWTAFLHEGLDQQTRYFYRLRAFNEAGPGAWSAVVSAATPVRLQFQYLVSFYDLPYTADPAGRTWQSFRLRQTSGSDSPFLAHASVALKNTLGETGPILFSASSTITSNIGQLDPPISAFDANPFDWFTPGQLGQRTTYTFNQSNSSITYRFDGFDPADEVTFELVIRRTDSNRNISVVVLDGNGVSTPLLTSADSGVTRYLTHRASGSENYRFVLTGISNAWVGSINAMSLTVLRVGGETDPFTDWLAENFGPQATGDDVVTRQGVTLTLREVWVAGLTPHGEDLFRVYLDAQQLPRFEPDLGGQRSYTLLWTDNLRATPVLWRNLALETPPPIGPVFYKAEVQLP